MNEKSIDILKAATDGIRADYVARYTEIELDQLQRDRAGLAAVGMDLEIYAPYPSTRANRQEYRIQIAKRHRVSASFESVKGCRSMHDPDIVVERPEAEPRLRSKAKRDANALVDAYLSKLGGKIGKAIVSASTNGRIWDSATLTVVCEDGETQTWNTKCILNRSIYGKIFNQWPTRRA